MHKLLLLSDVFSKDLLVGREVLLHHRLGSYTTQQARFGKLIGKDGGLFDVGFAGALIITIKVVFNSIQSYVRTTVFLGEVVVVSAKLNLAITSPLGRLTLVYY